MGGELRRCDGVHPRLEFGDGIGVALEVAVFQDDVGDLLRGGALDLERRGGRGERRDVVIVDHDLVSEAGDGGAVLVPDVRLRGRDEVVDDLPQQGVFRFRVDGLEEVVEEQRRTALLHVARGDLLGEVGATARLELLDRALDRRFHAVGHVFLAGAARVGIRAARLEIREGVVDGFGPVAVARLARAHVRRQAGRLVRLGERVVVAAVGFALEEQAAVRAVAVRSLQVGDGSVVDGPHAGEEAFPALRHVDAAQDVAVAVHGHFLVGLEVGGLAQVDLVRGVEPLGEAAVGVGHGEGAVRELVAVREGDRVEREGEVGDVLDGGRVHGPEAGADVLEDLETIPDAFGEQVPEHGGEPVAAGEAVRALGFRHRRDQALVVPFLEGDGLAADLDVERVGRGGEVGVDGPLDGHDAARRERLAVAVVLEVDGLPDAFRDVRPAAEHPRNGPEEDVARRVVRAFLKLGAEHAGEADAVGRRGDDLALAERCRLDVGDGLLFAGVDALLRELDEGAERVVVSVYVYGGHG